MDRTGLLKNQLYDEILDGFESEEVTSVYSVRESESRMNRTSVTSAGSSSSDESEAEHEAPAATVVGGGQLEGSPHDDDTEEEEEDDDYDEDTEDDDEPGDVPEGAYDPADYTNLPVSSEIRELFQYITRYTPQTMELEHGLKPFIPGFIPAVGDIDAFLKVPRPDGKADDLGLLVLDEPSVKQSDPTVLLLWLSEETKQHGAAELKKVTSVSSPQSIPRAVDSWVESIGALRRSKAVASVQYARVMPDMDSLMQEWPAELDELLRCLQPPPASLHCSLMQYCDLVCSLLDVPVYGSRVHALHLLFSLYLELRDLPHFTR